MTHRISVPLIVVVLTFALLSAACDRGDSATPGQAIEAGAQALAETVEEAAPEGAPEPEAPAESASPEPSAEAAPAPPAADAPAVAMGHDHETIEVDESEIVAQPGASLGDAARCPVSGEAFRVRDTSPSAEHDGETFYFCCGSCVRPFLRNPDQYLASGE